MTPAEVLTWYDVLAKGGFPLALFLLVLAFVKGWLPTPREREILNARIAFLEGDNKWLRDSLLTSLGLVTRFGTVLSVPQSSITPSQPNGG